MEDGFEQSSSGDYSGRTHGRSSKISGKNPIFSMPFGSPHLHHLKSTDVRRRPWIFYFLLYFQYLSLRLSKTNPPMYLHQRIYYRS